MRRSAGLIVSLAGAISGAAAQDCLWTARPGGPTGGGVAMYDPAAAWTLYLEPGSVALRLWAWNGTVWTLLDNTGPGRFDFAAAYDTTRGRLVLFGGSLNFSGPYPPETREWNGSAWVQVAASGPPGRRGHAMVFDSARGRVVLFGGYSNGGTFGDTWEWDGAAWTQSMAAGPSPRRDHAMAFDSTRGRTVLFGGLWSSPLGELWEWDGSAWNQALSGPAARSGAALVHDAARGRLILIGNSGVLSSPAVNGETWEFDPVGRTWDLRSAGIPAVAGAAAMDLQRALVVLVNGGPDSWEYNGNAAAAAPWVGRNPVGGLYTPGSRVELTVEALGTPPLSYQWLRNGAPVVNGGPISGANTSRLVIDPAATLHSGAYSVAITNLCGQSLSGSVGVSVLGPCYPNCDGSTTWPVLNVMDFICFQSRYAAGDSYANCDNSTVAPILNVNDFICFQNRYNIGCQ